MIKYSEEDRSFTSRSRYIPFQKEASEESLGWFVKVSAACVWGHMNRRSKSYLSGELTAPLISKYCCFVAGKRRDQRTQNEITLCTWTKKIKYNLGFVINPRYKGYSNTNKMDILKFGCWDVEWAEISRLLQNFWPSLVTFVNIYSYRKYLEIIIWCLVKLLQNVAKFLKSVLYHYMYVLIDF